jgi:hypothetical protein
MGFDGMMGGGAWGMSLVGILVLVLDRSQLRCHAALPTRLSSEAVGELHQIS